MGLFFDDKKSEPPPQSSRPGFFHEAGILLITTIFGVMAWLGKGLISFTLDNTPVKVKLMLLIAIPVLMYSLVPQVHDFMTLSSVTTINIVGAPVPLPDRSQFYRRDGGKFVIGDITYYTFRPHHFFIREKECYLVRRGEFSSFKTYRRPIYAIGFDEEVLDTSDVKIGELSFPQKAREYFLNPGNLFLLITGHNDVVSGTTVSKDITTSFDALLVNWRYLETKQIFISAKWNEYGMICF